MTRSIVFLYLIILPSFVFAQTNQEESTKIESRFSRILRSHDVRVALQNVGIGMPPNFVNGKLHPGLLIGIQKKIRRTTQWDYHLDLGYFAIHSLQRVAYIKPGMGYTVSIAKKLELRPTINFALMGVGQINDEFKFVNGQYEKVARHRLQVAPSFGLESFTTVVKKKNIAYQAMLAYEFGVQLPFSSLSSILPLNQIKIGVRIKK